MRPLSQVLTHEVSVGKDLYISYKIQESINRPFEFRSPTAKDVKPYQGIGKTTQRNGLGSRGLT